MASHRSCTPMANCPKSNTFVPVLFSDTVPGILLAWKDRGDPYYREQQHPCLPEFVCQGFVLGGRQERRSCFPRSNQQNTLPHQEAPSSPVVTGTHWERHFLCLTEGNGNLLADALLPRRATHQFSYPSCIC